MKIFYFFVKKFAKIRKNLFSNGDFFVIIIIRNYARGKSAFTINF